MAWQSTTTDADSPVVKAISSTRSLLRFHAARTTDKAAFLDADLARLRFGNNKAFGEEKAARYKAALKRFIKEFGDHEISA